MPDRRQESYAVRLEAAELARSRNHPQHQANRDEQQYAHEQYFMSFTKGLPHNPHTGLLQESQDFVEFRRAIDDGFIDPFSDRVRHGAKFKVNLSTDAVEPETDTKLTEDFRQWEAPTAGVVHELQGPDAQAVTMPPAPPLLDASGQANPELILEMAEVYELAVLRDQPFNDFESGQSNSSIAEARARLNTLDYVQNQTGRPRKVSSSNTLDAQTLFRGSSPGVTVGPYLSQFLLMGNVDINGEGSVADGKIAYGVLQVDQKVPVAVPCKDFMVNLDKYVEVQRGVQQPKEPYLPAEGSQRAARRFISTPRDLASYVHYDALYEAYLNACIVLLGMGTPFDPSFDHLSGVGAAAGNVETRRHAGGFALYGGPHILNLVTEVATRALKAVRFQKFNNHIRLRPEALASRIELARLASDPALCNAFEGKVPHSIKTHVNQFKETLENNGTLSAIQSLTEKNGAYKGTYLLPMAFPEGSPMHPAYGAGHATVAGACVTILKAFFDTSAVLVERKAKNPRYGKSNKEVKFARYDAKRDQAIAFRAPTITSATDIPTGDLIACEPNQPLTLEGELNKLAANISIGRDMAGVHYFSDYYDSLRMGEQIALGILEEQALTYTTEPFVLSVPTVAGDGVRIGHR